MLTIEEKKFFFKKKNIWFSESPFDVTDCDAVFFFACKKNVDLPGFEKREAPTIIIDLEEDLDTLWKGIGKTTRKNINRAIRSEVNITLNDNYEQFYEMYARFARKKQFKAYPFDIETMKSQGTLFTAELNDNIVAGVLALEDSNTIRALIGGSTRLEAEEKTAKLVSCAYKLLHWEMMKYAYEKGIRKFDFGGYYAGSDKNNPMNTINTFKLRFGGKIVLYYNYMKYYSRIYALAKRVAKIIR